MDLPKYIPGLIVLYNKDQFNQGMFAISRAEFNETWTYFDHTGKIVANESEIVGIVNGGLYVPAERFTGVVPAPQNRADDAVKDELEKDLELDADEEAFIEAHKNDRPAPKGKKNGKAQQ